MHLIKEWWFLIAFTIGIFGGNIYSTINIQSIKIGGATHD